MIETSRLLLRDFKLEDLEDVYAYASDIEVVRRFPFGPSRLEETRAFLEQLVSQPREEPRSFYDLAIALKESGCVIGSCFLKVEGRPEPTGFLTYLLTRAYWGQGYATETARALVEYAFVERGAHRVYTYCNPDNFASQRVLEKVGMQREGLIRESEWNRGAWHDEYLYAVLRRDRQESRTK